MRERREHGHRPLVDRGLPANGPAPHPPSPRRGRGLSLGSPTPGQVARERPRSGGVASRDGCCPAGAGWRLRGISPTPRPLAADCGDAAAGAGRAVGPCRRQHSDNRGRPRSSWWRVYSPGRDVAPLSKGSPRVRTCVEQGRGARTSPAPGSCCTGPSARCSRAIRTHSAQRPDNSVECCWFP